jgi:hypothetical protein
VNTINISNMVLARWGDGSFTLTGWGFVWAIFVATSFGSFVRELVTPWSFRKDLRRLMRDARITKVEGEK